MDFIEKGEKMYTNKHFKKLNIEPLYKVDIREKCEFANKTAALFVDTFPEHNLDYLRIVDLLQHTEMYISKVPNNISPVNYSYIDEVMYISDETGLDLKNEFLLHEVIHRIQEDRNKKNKLTQLGLCNILETKIQGLAINEAAIQYIVQKLLHTDRQIVEIYDMEIPTGSKNYYPIITNLIEQMAFVLGDNLLIDSSLNSKEDFKYNAIDNLGESNYFTIQTNFDKILEAKNGILKYQDIGTNTDMIKNTYVETQNLILKSYFDRIGKRIETTNELKTYYNKLFGFRNFIGSNDGKYLYIEYFRNKEEKIKKMEYDLENKSLMVVKNTPILRIFRKIKNFFQKKVYQN